ncbi:MAG TPA: aquaporin [Gemmatimonadales bacterium]|nr:aquaporin [Gemmatimonadales bacterium]
MRPLVPRVIAEMFGTFVLILFGAGSAVINSFPNAQYGVFGIAVVHGIALAIAISATMAISGGHLNPAVTIGLLSIKKISAPDAFAYVVAQLSGGLLGALAVKTLVAPNVGRVVGYGAPALHNTMTITTGIALEAILTFFLMSAVMGTAVSKHAPKIAGFGIGLTLIPGIVVGGPLTGAALNPARAFGPAIMSGSMQAQAVWWIGPIVGAVVAAVLWNYVLLGKEEAA